MPSIYFDNWVDFFEGGAAALLSEEINFNHTLDQDQCRSALSRNQETVFIARLQLNGRLALFHHFNETGDTSTVMDPVATAGFIMGLGDSSSTTNVVTPDLEILLKKPDARDLRSVPTSTNLLNPENLDNLATLQTGSTEVKPRNFSAVPPFLVRTMHQSIIASKGDPLSALVAAVTIINQFKENHAHDEEFTDKAAQKSEHFIFWLWTCVIENSPIQQIPVEPCTDAKLKATFATIQSSCIKVVVGGAEAKEVIQALDQVCAQNQVVAVHGSRKRRRSSQEQQFLTTATATETNNEEMNKSVNGNDTATVERRRKALKMNEHDSCTTSAPSLAELQLQHKSPNQMVTRTDTSPAFQKRIEELMAFKAKFGHCNVTASKSASNKPYRLLGKWCVQVRCSRRSLMEEGKPGKVKLCEARIGSLNALGFQWEVKRQTTFDERIEELRALKAKFGHCNVTQSKSASNKPYLSLGQWCADVRRSRRLMEEGKPGRNLCDAQIGSLNVLGFQWEAKGTNAIFDKRIEELRAFKAKFGHCNVTLSTSASNKPYLSLAKWCVRVRRSRRLMEEGKPGIQLKLSEAQIERLDALGF